MTLAWGGVPEYAGEEEMAKCVCCTALNAHKENRIRPSIMADLTARALDRRWNDVSKRETNRYCALHSGTGIGRATGEFIPLAAESLKQRKAAEEAKAAL